MLNSQAVLIVTYKVRVCLMAMEGLENFSLESSKSEPAAKQRRVLPGSSSFPLAPAT